MTGLFPIAVGVGLQDGLNPCIFMSCAVFIAYGLWAKARSLPVFWLRLIFVMVYLLGAAAFNFGPLQVFAFQKIVIIAYKILYLILSVGAFAAGALLLKDWFLLTRGLPSEIPLDRKIKPFKWGWLVAFLLTLLLPIILSGMATLWPINTYLMLLGNEAIIRGEWRLVASLVSVYVVCSLWPLWLVWAFTGIRKLPETTPRIIFSAVFFAASTTMIFIFK